MPPLRAAKVSEKAEIALDYSGLESVHRQVEPFLHPVASWDSVLVVRDSVSQRKLDAYLAEGRGLTSLQSLAVGADRQVTGFAARVQALRPVGFRDPPALSGLISQLEWIATEGGEAMAIELLERSRAVLRTGSVDAREQLALQIERFMGSLEGEKPLVQIAIEFVLALAGIDALAVPELRPSVSLPRARALRLGNIGQVEMTWSQRIGSSHLAALRGVTDPQTNYRQLLELCESPSASARAMAAQQLGGIPRDFFTPDKALEAFSALSRLASKDGDFWVRLKATEALVHIGGVLLRPSPVLKILIALCGDNERAVQMSAAKGLLLLTGREFPNPYAEGALEVLGHFAKSVDSETRLDLVMNLKGASEEFSPAILKELAVLLETLSRDENRWIQLNAAAGLIDIGMKLSDLRCIRLAMVALQDLHKDKGDGEDALRAEAVSLLAKIGKERFLPVFKDVLEELASLSREEGGYVSLEAAKGLWNAKKDSASAALLREIFADLKQLGKDPDPRTRAEAAEELGKLGKDLHHPVLIGEIFRELQGLSKDPDAWVKQHAAEALASLLTGLPDGMAPADALAVLQVFSRDESFYLRKAVIAPLASVAVKLADPGVFAEVLKALQRLCEDPEFIVQKEAFEALMDLANESPEFRKLLAAELRP